ncbi:Putative lipase YOR059C OS=Saccharomyces cerevisiae (strain ATCC 204508 / S288c) GN=YOR059C PE=1 SV=1 [Rhizoctonia solani AG-1 IB]|uniref:Putative lipase YOR059C n=1 Tax=Thanatephorus cucumeris (strain AG1-IB / isolate 7/3/14) TaxID=1108050 RepID=A0A0B7FV86_THACB|nr:Putative lipase YOR059C OS=Saccharomyces cerevisiae (strain ATCC 204508 / S288c) GN=YOR059C PE=1 SV=1 [Rhizoctonia solani AG-1 IB]
MSSSSSTLNPSPRNVHFLALVHGMWGAPEHLARVEETIKEKFVDVDGDTEFVSLRIRTNAESHTYDGLDWGAERAVKEIYETVEDIESDGQKTVTKFSIFGYSLGGLISRYAIGILYKRGFFRKVKPVNFTTFATPHLGLPRVPGFLGKIMHKLGPKMLSRTGKQFYGVDNDVWSSADKEGRPLLEVMADKDSVFFKALKSFPHVTFYGNAVNDLTVVYVTSMVEPHDPFTALKTKSHRLGIKMDPNYKHVIESFGEVPAGEEVPLSEIELEDKARRAALHWYSPERYKSSRPFLPPFLQFPFPINLIFYLLIPFLIPAGLTYATIRFSRESRSSRRRLEALADSPEAESSLAAMLRKMESAVADMVDSADPGVADEGWESDMETDTVVVEGQSEEAQKRKAASSSTPEVAAQSLPTPPAEEQERKLETKPMFNPPKPKPNDPLQPILSPAQLSMIESLNSIPQLKKVRAYFPYVRNAHSMIIVRDPKVFPIHEDGMGVIMHWADRFVL